MNNPYADPNRTAAAAALEALIGAPAPEKMPGRQLGVVTPVDLEDDEIQPPYFVAFGDSLSQEIFSRAEFESLKTARDYIERAFTEGYEAVRGHLGYEGEDFEEAWPSVTHALIHDELSEDVELLCVLELVKGHAA